jgi:hypothetical protein
LPPMSWASMDDVAIVHGDKAIVQYGIGTSALRHCGGGMPCSRNRGMKKKIRSTAQCC